MKLDEKINLRLKIDRYFRNWKWIVLSILLSLIIGYLYQRYLTRIYKATATILINDYRRAGFNSEISAFTDKFSLYNQNRVSIDNEMEFIKSRSNVREAIESLNLNITYHSDGNFKSEDIYSKSPIRIIRIDSLKNQSTDDFIVFELERINDSTFKLCDSEKKELGKYHYGSSFNFNNMRFVVDKMDNFHNSKLSNIFIRIEPLKSAIENFRNRIITINPGDETSVCEISFTDNCPERAIDFVNGLINAYEKSTVEEKRKQIKNTYDFVYDRLSDVEKSLDNTETSDERYKKQNEIVDVDIESGISLSKKEEFSNKINENNTTISLVENVIKEIFNDKPDYIPSNILPTNQILMGQMIKYNEDVSDFNKFSNGTFKDHPEFIEKRKKLISQKKSIIDGLNNFIKKLQEENSYYSKKYNIVLTKIRNLPVEEKEVNRSERKIGVISETYKYLMSKKEETAISLYSVSPNSKVIESAFCSFIPIYPSPKIIYIIALLLGLFFPIVIIYCISLFDTKIKNKKDVISKLSLPYIGDVSFSPTHLIAANNRNSAAESIRIVRANLEYVLQTIPVDQSTKKSRKIFITSTIPKEGKTFVAVNLALSFAQINKKVLLVGMDIRNPKFEEYFGEFGAKYGLTNYLCQDKKAIDEFIYVDSANSIDILPSGIIPPNPTALLMHNKVEKLFADLEIRYDYIIVDTAPISLVSDTILISKYADAFVYVLRHNYSDKRFLDEIDELQKDGKLVNPTLLINDVHSIKDMAMATVMAMEMIKNNN